MLAAKAAGLQQKHELEIQRAKLQSQMEILEAQRNIAAADAKLKVLESYESNINLQSTSDFVSQIQDDPMNEYFDTYAEKSHVEYTHLGLKHLSKDLWRSQNDNHQNL